VCQDLPETGYQPPLRTQSLKPDRIILIGDLLNLRTLVAECFGTLSLFTNSGNSEIFMILVDGLRIGKHHDSPGNSSAFDCSVNKRSDLMAISKRISRQIGISTLYVMNFDFRAASQQNVNLLRSLLDPLQPSMAIMPFLKCKAADQKILARSSLIACRGVQNLLMYNPDSSSSFRPQLVSNLATEDFAAKDACLKIVANSNLPTLAPFQVSSSVNSARAPTLLEGGVGEPTPLDEEMEPSPRSMRRPALVAPKTIESFAIHRLVFLS
jgi:hypothetical protein